MPRSYADVNTAVPERYTEQLPVRLGGTSSPGTDDSTVVRTDDGTVEVAGAPSLIAIKVEAADDDALGALQETVTQVLASLDDTGELVVEWHRSDA